MLDVLQTVEYDRKTGWNRRMVILRVGVLSKLPKVAPGDKKGDKKSIPDFCHHSSGTGSRLCNDTSYFMFVQREDY